MSTRPGGHVKKKPAQKHKNITAFKFDKYRSDPKAKALNNLEIINCCPKCTSVLEWKIKYGKYKPLTVPAKCVDCLQKNVKHSYHIRCDACVKKSGKCAKCGEKTEDFVNTQAPDQGDLDKDEAQFQRDLKCLPERRRRAFLRYMQRVHTTGEADSEEIKEKLSLLLEKCGRNKDDEFDFDDFGDDFDDLHIEDEEDSFSGNDSEN